MVILSTDTILVYPVSAGLGGPISNVRVPNNLLNNIWGNVSMADLEVGRTWYFSVYLYNDNKNSETLDNVRLFVYQPTISPYTDIAIALGTAPINSTESEIANKLSPPSGITNWTHGQSEDDSLFIGRLPPKSYKSIWLRLTVNVAPSGSSFPFENYVLLSRHNPVAGPIMTPGPGLPGEEPVPPPPGTPPPAPPSQIVNDQFGIRMVYPTSAVATVSAPFFLPATDPQLSARFDPGSTIASNGDGSWRNSVVNPRLRLFSAGDGGNVKSAVTSFGNAADTYDHSDVAARGYWWKPNDWKAVEATGHFIITDIGSEVPGAVGLHWFFRGLTSSPNVASGCGAAYYGAYLIADARTRFRKSHYNIDPDPEPCSDRQFLPSPAFTDPRLGVSRGSLVGKWIGFKAMIWNFTFDGVPTGWRWVNPTTLTDPDTGNPFPAAGNAIYDQWEIRYYGTDQYWYHTHRDNVVGAGSEVSLGKFYNYANAAKYLEYLRDNVLPSGLGVHMELWIDAALNNTWVRQGVFDDAGFWLAGSNENLSCPGGERCGGAHDQLLTWGSPVVELLVDSAIPAGAVHWKNLSVREITQPWSTYQLTDVGATTPPPPPTPPPTTPPPPPPAPAGAGNDAFGVVKLFATKSAGDEWFSTAWGNGTERFLGSGDTDPSDSRFLYSNGDPDTTEVRIDGNSHLWQTEFNTSFRLFVSGNWLNTEQTIFLRRETGDTGNGPGSGSPTAGDGEDIQLRSRANHDKHFVGQTPDNCGWGNYLVKWETGAAAISVEVEPLHSLYRRHLGEVTWATPEFPMTQWIGFKQITRTRTADNNVVVEGWMCTDIAQAGNISGWVKNTEFVFNGTNINMNLSTESQTRCNECVGKGDNQVVGTSSPTALDAATKWLNPGLYCWIRANNFNNVRVKWSSVREIDPMGAGPVDESPPPPPPATVDDFGISWIYPRPSTGGTMWHSVDWDNGNSRTVPGNCGVDPDDNALHHTDNDGSVCSIDGAGIMKVTQSGRISIHRNLRNVEATIYVRWPSAMEGGNCHFQPKTEHYCLPDNSGEDHDLFGGYILYIDTNDLLYFKKEQSHNIGYSDRLGSVNVTMSPNTWYGFKAMCYNKGNNVVLEAWMDTTGGVNGGTWVKKISLTDNGTWSIGGSLYAPSTGQMREGAIRTDSQGTGSYMEYKWMSFREIQPP